MKTIKSTPYLDSLIETLQILSDSDVSDPMDLVLLQAMKEIREIITEVKIG